MTVVARGEPRPEPTPQMRECVQRFAALRKLPHVCPNLCCCRCSLERLGPHLLALWMSEQ
jgi:hypothetical protein